MSEGIGVVLFVHILRYLIVLLGFDTSVLIGVPLWDFFFFFLVVIYNCGVKFVVRVVVVGIFFLNQLRWVGKLGLIVIF